MICVDTNVLIRAIVLDDHSQAEHATRLLSKNICFVARSVVQEIVWVLAKSYRFGPSDIGLVLEALTQSEQIVLEDEPLILLALDWYKKGFDFADAIHLAAALRCERLATFDQAFIKAAQALQTPIPVSHP
ncbi:type II toxin-antitoxin system VapC family toxin [Aquidulcibacter sp.]|jgi:predicted nucleic-acid-binding protein|uniref:type II toxin-antitoxin system VapC family toxin n=1 Tax=Aquidulcibacter sp. TaxID=2052990 RepID=UPI0037C0562A